MSRVLNANPDSDALSTEVLIVELYRDIRNLANSKLRNERSDHTLQTTALVNEAYLRLQSRHGWINQQQFLAVAADTMRNVLTDHARRKLTKRRGGDLKKQPLVLGDISLPMPPEDFLLLDEAVESLKNVCPEAAELCRLRFYLRMTQTEAAASLQISKSTAERRWAFAKAYLYSRMSPDTSKKFVD